MGKPVYALFMSVCGIITIYHGTRYSIKNISWGTMIWLSLPASMWATFLRGILHEIDEDRAYSLYIILKLICRGTEFMFGFACAMVLLLTAIGKMWNKSD